MSKIRSYFDKNNTLVKGNNTNNSQNPVTEILYGDTNGLFTRFIFKVNLSNLTSLVTGGTITESNITSHKLKLTNTISLRPDLIGKTFADFVTKRATSVTMQLFKIDEEWDEGNGYDFFPYTGDTLLLTNALVNTSAANYYYRKTNVLWTEEGSYLTTGATVLNTIDFSRGDEDIDVDITNYINGILFSGDTTEGLGLAYTPAIEALTATTQLGIAFFTKYTNTFYEPFIETTLDDLVEDDRNYFYMDKDNKLYLYSKKGGDFSDVTISGVTIYDSNGEIYSQIPASAVTRQSKGVYYITVNIDSDSYYDSVLFEDYWNIVDNGKNKTIEQEFFLINRDKYSDFSLAGGNINLNNYAFSFSGIKEGEKFQRGNKRKVSINIRKLYQQDDLLPLQIQYRLYVTQGGKTQINVIPFTNVNRSLNEYYLYLDTSWMIENEYNLELKLKTQEQEIVKKSINFFVVS